MLLRLLLLLLLGPGVVALSLSQHSGRFSWRPAANGRVASPAHWSTWRGLNGPKGTATCALHGSTQVAARATIMCCTAPSLTGKQRRHLRAVAGRLEAQQTLSRMQVADPETSLFALREQLAAAELVRCKFVSVKKKAEAKQLAEVMAERVDATVAQVLGHTALFYKPSSKGLIEFPPASEGSA